MDPAVIGKQLKQQYPQYAQMDDAALGQKYLQKYGGAVQAVQGGQLKVTDIPEAQRVGVAIGLNATGYKAPEKAADTKNKESYDAALNLINNLEGHYQNAGGASFGSGPEGRILGFLTSLQGKAGFNDNASAYEREKSGFAATLKQLTGDTGVLTDQDYARLSKLLPDLGSTPGEAKSLLNDLRSQMAAKFQGGQTNTSVNPKNPRMDPLLDLLFGNAINIAQDVGTGIRSKAAQPNLQRNEQQAQSLEDQAYATSNPQQRKDLLANANQSRTAASGEARDISNSFSPQVQDNPIMRSLAGASEIGAAAEVPGLVKGATGAVRKVLHPFKTVGDMRQAAITAAEGKTISGDKIYSALEDNVGKLSPTTKQAYLKFLEQASPELKGQKIPISQAVELASSANDAYNAAGKVGKAASAKFNDSLSKVLRVEIKAVAPEVSKKNTLFRYLYGAEDLGKKAFVPAAAGGAGYFLINKLLGGQR